LVRIQEDYFGMIPSSTLRSNVPRNLLILIASRFSASYSSFSLTRERLAVDEYRRRHSSLLIDSSVNLPKWKGKQLPDIDLLPANSSLTHLVVAELKWQLSASSTREVASRNDYLKKGHRATCGDSPVPKREPQLFDEPRIDRIVNRRH